MEKLLVITQKIDKGDGILGFFHGWLKAFHTVGVPMSAICLSKGKTDLPEEISVYSLGKENSAVSKIVYAIRFYKLLWSLRGTYDNVFVHMNQEYILLAGLFWRMTGKKVIFWYNHTHGNIFTKIAMGLANRTCHTSLYAATSGTSKSVRMPAGIDTNIFNEEYGGTHKDILFLGRISPVKNVDIFVRALIILKRKGIDFGAKIYGSPGRGENEYYESIVNLSEENDLNLAFMGPVSNFEAPSVYRDSLVTVNLTPKGNYDKTVLEAALCGSISVASSEAFIDMIPKECMFAEGDADDLARVLEEISSATKEKKDEIVKVEKDYVFENHSLSSLVVALKNLFINKI